MKDNQFVTQMMVILGILLGLTVFILAIANVVISDTDYSEDSVIQGNIEERIKPVGNVSLAGESDGSQEVQVASAGDSATSEMSAEQLYAPCGACHATGVLNAPKLGDKAAWQPRIAKGTEKLYLGAVNGIGTMPAKGGRADYSDDDIKKIVDYMLESVQ